MIKCNNNCGETTTPVNPCQQDPCANVNKDEVIIKQYIDECCRKIYPVTSSDAVIAKTGTSLTESLNNFESRINTILATIRSIEANSNDYSTEINNLARQLTTVSANVSVLINGGSTDDIGVRIDAIEVLIAKINEQLMLLLEATGKAGCDPIEVKTYDNVYVTHSGTIYPNTANWAHIQVYKVVPESIIKVIFENENTRTVNDSATFSLISFATASEFNAGDTVTVPDISGNKINFQDIDTGRIEFNNITVPSDKQYLLISYGDLSRNGQIRKMVPSVIAVQCPEEDDDSSSGGGSGDENKIEDIFDPNNDSLLDTTTKIAQIPDVLTPFGTSIYNGKNFVLPTVLPVHGYLAPDVDWNYQNSGFYLSSSPLGFVPLTNVADGYSGYMYGYVNDFNQRINNTIIQPVKTYVHCCLYTNDINAQSDNYKLAPIGEFNSTDYNVWGGSNYWDIDQEHTYEDMSIDITSKVKGQISKHYEKVKVEGGFAFTLTTKNHIVSIYEVKPGHSYKILRKNNEGQSAIYSIFEGEDIMDSPDYATPIQVKVDSRGNSSISEFTITAPSPETNGNKIYLAVCNHAIGTTTVYNVIDQDQIISTAGVTIPHNSTITLVINECDGTESLSQESLATRFSDYDYLSIDESEYDSTSNTWEITITNDSDNDFYLDYDVINVTESNVSIDSIIHNVNDEIEPEGDIENSPRLLATSSSTITPITSDKKIYAIYYNCSGAGACENSSKVVEIPPYTIFYEIDSQRFMYLNSVGKLLTC